MRFVIIALVMVSLLVLGYVLYRLPAKRPLTTPEGPVKLESRAVSPPVRPAPPALEKLKGGAEDQQPGLLRISEENVLDRIDYVRRLAVTPGPGIPEELGALALHDKNALIRVEALNALAHRQRSSPPEGPVMPEGQGDVVSKGSKTEPPIAVREVLEKALDDRDPTVIQAAAAGLGRLHSRSSALKLCVTVEANRRRPDGYGEAIGRSCLEALRAIASPDSAGFLIQELRRPAHLNYQVEVIEALGMVRDPRAVGPLKEHLATLLDQEPKELIVRYPWQVAVEATRKALAASERP